MKLSYPRIAALFLACGWACAAAAQPRVELVLTGDQAHVNEPFLVELHVSDAQTVEPPEPPDIPDAAVRFAGQQSVRNIEIVGRRQKIVSRIEFVFEITPRKTGELRIPPFVVHADNQELRTAPRRVAVAPSDAADLMFVRIRADKEKAYVGQRLRLTLEVWVKPVTVAGRLRTPEETFGDLDGGSTAFGPFPVPRQVARRAHPTADGSESTYYVFLSTTDYRPEQPGPLRFDDVQIGMDYPTRFVRDIFDIRASSSRPIRARCHETVAEVLPLPEEGRPAVFNGAVGRYTMTAYATPTDVRVGDPIELAFEIRGNGPIDSLRAPDLTQQPQLTAAFRVPQESLAGQVLNDRKRFTQVIRPRSADVTHVPPIEFAYFDPELGEYAVARSRPIPIRVRPVESLTPEDLTSLSAAPEASQSQPLQTIDGLRDIDADVGRILATRKRVEPWHAVGAVVAPAGVYLLAWGGLRLRQRQAQGPGRRKEAALRTARRRLDDLPAHAAEAARAIRGALVNYVAQRTRQSSAALEGDALLTHLVRSGAPDNVIVACRTLLQETERIGYGGATAANIDSLRSVALECLENLHRSRL